MDISDLAVSREELNKAALDIFLRESSTSQVVPQLVKAATETVQHDLAAIHWPSSSVFPQWDGGVPPLEEFIVHLITGSHAPVATLTGALVYMRKLKIRLLPGARGRICVRHRIFLASLILAAKYLNDSSPLNQTWAEYSVISKGGYIFCFTKAEVNLMEKQLLSLLDWDLRITMDDLYGALEPCLRPVRELIRTHPPQSDGTQSRLGRKSARHSIRKALFSAKQDAGASRCENVTEPPKEQ